MTETSLPAAKGDQLLTITIKTHRAQKATTVISLTGASQYGDFEGITITYSRMTWDQRSVTGELGRVLFPPLNEFFYHRIQSLLIHRFR
jgi:hypothetical protein